MTTVVDAGVVIKWFVPEADHKAARALLQNEASLTAPDLLVSEVTNIAWKKTVRNEIGHAQARLIVSGFRKSGIELLPSFPVRERALEIGLTLGHPTNDCFYIATAERLGVPFVTADRRLHAIAGDTIFKDLILPLSGRTQL